MDMDTTKSMKTVISICKRSEQKSTKYQREMYMFNSTKPINDHEHIETTLSTILPDLKHGNHVADAFVLNNNHLKTAKILVSYLMEIYNKRYCYKTC